MFPPPISHLPLSISFFPLSISHLPSSNLPSPTFHLPFPLFVSHLPISISHLPVSISHLPLSISLFRSSISRALNVLAPYHFLAGAALTLAPTAPLVHLHASPHSLLPSAPRGLRWRIPSRARHCLRRVARALRACAIALRDVVLIHAPCQPSPTRPFQAHPFRACFRLPAAGLLSRRLVACLLVLHQTPRQTALLAAPRPRGHLPATARPRALRRILYPCWLLHAPLHAQHRAAAWVLPHDFDRRSPLCSALLARSPSLLCIVSLLFARSLATRLAPPLATLHLAAACPGLFPALGRRRSVIDALAPAVAGGHRRCARHGFHALLGHTCAPPWLHPASRHTSSARAS
ncbi:unnamed protein product [Closterium sp. NIES-53]